MRNIKINRRGFQSVYWKAERLIAEDVECIIVLAPTPQLAGGLTSCGLP
jgi:hypothetical protein